MDENWTTVMVGSLFGYCFVVDRSTWGDCNDVRTGENLEIDEQQSVIWQSCLQICRYTWRCISRLPRRIHFQAFRPNSTTAVSDFRRRFAVKPNTHCRRRRDATVEFRDVAVARNLFFFWGGGIKLLNSRFDVILPHKKFTWADFEGINTNIHPRRYAPGRVESHRRCIY